MTATLCHLLSRPALSLLGLATLLSLSACGEGPARPRLLELTISQETRYVGVAVQAARAGTDEWLMEQCESRLKPTEIRVSSEPSKITYDFTRSVQELTQESGSAKRGQSTLGLTKVSFQTSLRYSGNYLVDQPTRKACMRPVVSVKLTVSPQTVFVAREFPQGTCMFNEVAQHELRHVQANQDAVEGAADALQAEMARHYGNRIFMGPQAELQRQLEEEMGRRWMPWAQAELERRRKVHEQIDSPQEYARLGQVCNGAARAALAR